MMINGTNMNDENVSAEGLTLEKIAMIKNMLDDPFIRMYISDSYYHKSHLNEAIETLRKIENDILETAYKRRRGYGLERSDLDFIFSRG